ncbi:MAG: DUF371 domain-containing protein [Promethearchaeota archaeon]
MKIIEKIVAYGHNNISCTHGTTIELTKDKHLSRKGNCILGINASKSCYDLNTNLKQAIFNGNKLKVTLKVDNFIDNFDGYGSKQLSLSNKNDIVFRKSNFICDRTILINCTKSSNELNRDMIKLLNNPEKKIKITFILNDTDG